MRRKKAERMGVYQNRGSPHRIRCGLQAADTAVSACLLTLTLAFLLGGQPLPSASAPHQTISQARNTSPGHSNTPIILRGTVTAFSGWKTSFFLQDTTDAISVDRAENTLVQPGDVVEVTGQTQPGMFANIFVSDSIRVLRSSGLPPPLVATYRQLQTGAFDSRFVEVSGRVHAARMVDLWGHRVLAIDLEVDDHSIRAYLPSYSNGDYQYLVDSQIEIRGVCGTIFNHRHQLMGLRLFVPSLRQLEVVAKGIDPATIPVSRLDRLLTFQGPSLDHRVRVRGTITYQAPGGEVFMQDGQTAVRVLGAAGSWTPGTEAEALGFVSTNGYLPDIDNAFLRNVGQGKVPAPLRIRATDVITFANDFQEAPYDGLLVQLDGKIVDRLENTHSLLWSIEGHGVRFEAEIVDPPPAWALDFEAGTDVRLTGICLAEADKHKNLKSFHILLRSPADMFVTRKPYLSQSLLILLVIYASILTGSFIIYLWQKPKFSEPDLSLSHEGNPPIEAGCRRLARGLAIFAMLLTAAAFGLGGRPNAFAGVTLIPQSVVLTGPILIVAALTILLRNRTSGQTSSLLGLICAAIVSVAGCLEVVGGFAGWDFAKSLHAPLSTALSLVLLGCAGVLVKSRRLAGAGQVLMVIVAFTAILKLVGTLYGAGGSSGVAAHLFMSIPVAVALLLLSLAMLLANPQDGLMKTVCAPRLGGLMLRRLIPAAIVAPILLGWIRLQLQVFGLFDTRFGLTLFALSNALCFCFLMWTTAFFLNRLERLKSRTEERLHEREDKLGLIFETGSIGDWNWNVEPDQLFAHPSVWKLYGAPDKQGSEPAAWFRGRQHPDDLAWIENEVAKCQDKRKPLDIEFRVIWPDASIHWVYCRAVPVFNGAGKLIQMSGINLDVTDRKVAEAKLKESEVLFRKLQDAMPQIVWTADRHGVTTHYNQRWYEYTGLLPGEGWQKIIPSADVDSVTEKWGRSVATGTPYENELLLRCASDGAYRWHLLRAVPVFNAQGQVEQWFGTCTDIDDFQRAKEALVRDVAERRRTEILLIAAQRRAEDANVAKSRFLASMSHEIRTPMNAILGMADLLWETVLNHDQREYVGRFRRAGANLLSLINDILDLSKIESGRLELEAVDFDLRELLERVVEIASPGATLKGISLETQVLSGTPVSLIGDPVRLQQILNNLVSNAIKFTPRGKVLLQVGSHAAGEKGHLQFAISDTGIGIPAEKLDSIFEDFTQAETYTTRRFGGTGLGLGICRRLVEKMKGLLTVESVVGQGSTFHFDARFAVSAGVAEGAPKLVTDLTGKSVIIVDDNSTNRLILCQMCASWGMTTSVAASAAETLALLAEVGEANREVSLVVLDRLLPDANGFDALRKIRRVCPHIPVIIVSSDNQTGDLTESKALGVAAYLMKPVRRAELLNGIFDALSTRQAAGASNAAGRKTALRILVVEDSEDNRFLVDAYLEGKGHHLSFAEDGEKAVEAFCQEKFDIVFMDVQMPVMDGLTATKRIRAIERERGQEQTVIVALTANALLEDTRRSHEAGCNSHLVKPISKDKLLAAIDGYQNLLPHSETPAEYVISIPPGFEAASRKYIEKQLASIPEIRSSLAKGSFEQLQIIGHRMRGTSSAYGFPDLSILGGAIEDAVRTSDFEQIEDHVANLERYVHYAVDSLCVAQD